MPNECALQVPVIGLHAFGSAPPGRDRAFGNGLGRIRNHQFGIADQFRAKPMADRAGAEVAIERKMPRSEFA